MNLIIRRRKRWLTAKKVKLVGLNLKTLMTSKNYKNFAAHPLDPQQKKQKKNLGNRSAGSTLARFKKFCVKFFKILFYFDLTSFWTRIRQKALYHGTHQTTPVPMRYKTQNRKIGKKNILFSRHLENKNPSCIQKELQRI